jgi:hypothetical protein
MDSVYKMYFKFLHKFQRQNMWTEKDDFSIMHSVEQHTNPWPQESAEPKLKVKMLASPLWMS